MCMRSTANDDCLGIILMTALNAARPLPPTFQHPPSPSSPSSASLWSSWSSPPTSSMMIHHNDAILLAFHAIMICNGNLKLSLAKKMRQCEKSKKTNIKERDRKIRRHKDNLFPHSDGEVGWGFLGYLSLSSSLYLHRHRHNRIHHPVHQDDHNSNDRSECSKAPPAHLSTPTFSLLWCFSKVQSAPSPFYFNSILKLHNVHHCNLFLLNVFKSLRRPVRS